MADAKISNAIAGNWIRKNRTGLSFNGYLRSTENMTQDDQQNDTNAMNLKQNRQSERSRR